MQEIHELTLAASQPEATEEEIERVAKFYAKKHLAEYIYMEHVNMKNPTRQLENFRLELGIKAEEMSVFEIVQMLVDTFAKIEDGEIESREMFFGDRKTNPPHTGKEKTNL